MSRWVTDRKYVLVLIVVIASVLFFLLNIIGWLRFSVLYSVLIGLAVYYIFKTFPQIKERKFILSLFIIALLIRILFTVISHQYSVKNNYEGFIYYTLKPSANDEIFYHSTSKQIAGSFEKNLFFFLNWEEAAAIIIQDIHFSYNVFLGILYYLCGSNMLFGKLINCFLGAVVVLYTYMIGMKFLDVNSARLGALLVAIDSYAIMFSGFLYKEMLLTFVFMCFIWHFLCFIKTEKKYHLIICLIAALIGLAGRVYLGGSLLFAAFMFFIIFYAPKESTKRFIYITVLFLIASPVIYIGGSYAYKRIAGGGVRSRAVGAKSWTRTSEDEETNVKEAFSPKRVVVNFARMFFSPMPWRDLSETMEPIIYSGYPGRWLWYVFMPFFIYGIYYYAYDKFKIMFMPTFSLFLYLFICAVVMMSGSRHHVSIMPFIFLTSAAGFCHSKNPLFIYVAYLPLLVAFFHFDMNTLNKLMPTAVILSIVYIIYLSIMIHKKMGFDKLIKIITITPSGNSTVEDRHK